MTRRGRCTSAVHRFLSRNTITAVRFSTSEMASTCQVRDRVTAGAMANPRGRGKEHSDDQLVLESRAAVTCAHCSRV